MTTTITITPLSSRLTALAHIAWNSRSYSCSTADRSWANIKYTEFLRFDINLILIRLVGSAGLESLSVRGWLMTIFCTLCTAWLSFDNKNFCTVKMMRLCLLLLRITNVTPDCKQTHVIRFLHLISIVQFKRLFDFHE